MLLTLLRGWCLGGYRDEAWRLTGGWWTLLSRRDGWGRRMLIQGKSSLCNNNLF